MTDREAFGENSAFLAITHEIVGGMPELEDKDGVISSAVDTFVRKMKNAAPGSLIIVFLYEKDKYRLPTIEANVILNDDKIDLGKVVDQVHDAQQEFRISVNSRLDIFVDWLDLDPDSYIRELREKAAKGEGPQVLAIL